MDFDLPGPTVNVLIVGIQRIIETLDNIFKDRVIEYIYVVWVWYKVLFKLFCNGINGMFTP